MARRRGKRKNPPLITRKHASALAVSGPRTVLVVHDSGHITLTTPDAFLTGGAGRIALCRADLDEAGVRFIADSGGRLARGSGEILDPLLADVNAYLAATWTHARPPHVTHVLARAVLAPDGDYTAVVLDEDGAVTLATDDDLPGRGRVLLTRAELNAAGVQGFGSISGRIARGSAPLFTAFLADLNTRLAQEFAVPAPESLSDFLATLRPRERTPT
ncbi:hypothetical protein [Streptosporangium sp. NPDC002524]|uniref:hypothetical protein n=1 Tax=Streptosporangium sp. NPDC002524 TaxID=3154537 RepID=UPI003322537C